jgi:hypothetical protein
LGYGILRKERLLMCMRKGALLGVFLIAGLLLGCSDEPASPEQGISVPVYTAEFHVDATAMTVDDDGHLLFANPIENQITRRTVRGDSIGEWNLRSQADSILWPMYIEYSKGKLVVVSASPSPSRIVVFDSLGVFQREWLEWHDNSGGWAGGVDQIAIDSHGYVYTLRFDEETVVKYAPDGTFEREWLAHGTNSTGATMPGGIVVGLNDIVYITDTAHHKVLMFSNNGEPIGEIGKRGSGKAQFQCPIGLAIDNNNILYVVDRLNHRVQMLNLDGNYLAEFATGAQLKTPLLITTWGNGVHVLHEDGLVQYFRFAK